MASSPIGLSFSPMDIRFWLAATTRCTVAKWNSDVAFEPWSKLYLAVEGRARYAVARENESPHWCDLVPGQLYLIPGGRRHINSCRREFVLSWCHFTVQDPDLSARIAAMDSILSIPLAEYPHAAVVVPQCCAGDDALRLRAQAVVLDSLARLPQPDPSAAGSARRRLQAAINHIEYHFHQPLAVPMLARLADLRPSRFQEVFRQAVGTSVKSYQLGLRLAEAKRLLRDTATPIQTIANQIGYDQPFHFTRIFTRHVGVSPSRWRHLSTKDELSR